MPNFSRSNGAVLRQAALGYRRFVGTTGRHVGFRWWVFAASAASLFCRNSIRMEGQSTRHRAVHHHPSSRIPVAMPSILTVFLRSQYSLTPSGPIFSKYGTNSSSPRFPVNCMIGTPLPQEV